MATTLEETKRKILRLLGDTLLEEDESPVVAGRIYEADLLLDSIHAAIKRISMRFWKTAIFTISEAGSSYELPADLIDVDGVFDNETSTFIPRLAFQTGILLSSAIPDSNNAWFNYPGQGITFINDISDDGAKIYYLAHWELPDGDSDTLEIPEICITALVLFAASYCLLKTAVQSGDIAQYKTKVDSGQPTDIPAKDLSDFLLRRFENEMASLPMQTRNS